MNAPLPNLNILIQNAGTTFSDSFHHNWFGWLLWLAIGKSQKQTAKRWLKGKWPTWQHWIELRPKVMMMEVSAKWWKMVNEHTKHFQIIRVTLVCNCSVFARGSIFKPSFLGHYTAQSSVPSLHDTGHNIQPLDC